ncbi:MAG: SDR family NAD(P)-dependent oxidoreductase [Porphyrobacter sp.]|nr:SDR family NAD(P)-dependent oxidoreductase [Porphyrobacter sp.]
MSISVDLSGRRALITGASSGLGARFGRVLAANGAKVALGARRVERLAALAGEIGPAAAAIAMDVGQETDIIAGFDAAEAAFGGVIDTVIANAGVDGAGMITAMSEADIAHTLAVNLTGAILTAREGAKRMMAAGVTRGRIAISAPRSMPTGSKPNPARNRSPASRASA